MAVVLPNVTLVASIRSHPWTEDPHGVPTPSADDELEARGPFPCRADEADDKTWTFCLDPAMDPLRAGDRLNAGDRTWVLDGNPVLHAIPGYPAADYIAATGTLDPPKVP